MKVLGNNVFTKKKPVEKESAGKDNIHFLVLHNDDYHSFEYVIECLMEICGHNVVQAEQCTYLVHFKGSCDVLKGGYRQLLSYKNALAEKDLKVTIE